MASDSKHCRGGWEDGSRIIVKEVTPGQALEVKFGGFDDFCSFVERSGRATVVGFFRELARELEQERLLADFHIKVRDCSGAASGFKVEVFYGAQGKTGPVDVAPGECISCFADAALYPGKEPKVTAGDCIMAEVDGEGHVQCSIDAKARPGFVVTPVRHVERMSDLEDDELFALWSAAVKALRSEGLPAFRSMILNHGSYRNLPHLHLKVWVDPALHRPTRLAWTRHRQELWARLEMLAANNPTTKCRFYHTQRGCRHGHRCNFLHQ